MSSDITYQILYAAGLHAAVGVVLFYLLAGQFGISTGSYLILGGALFSTSIVVDYLYPKLTLNGTG
jgi:hypothetical protein